MPAMVTPADAGPVSFSIGRQQSGKLLTTQAASALHDGLYVGADADAYYGTVQVQASVQNGQLVSVKVLKFPNDRSTSRYINSQALPLLQQEAISAQSASVDVISGATLTSEAFINSLADALRQAGEMTPQSTTTNSA